MQIILYNTYISSFHVPITPLQRPKNAFNWASQFCQDSIALSYSFWGEILSHSIINHNPILYLIGFQQLCV